ncbi:hypothetical protein DFH09DRAFT_1375863 [Mycena vulgaris]|nr:hypothetical protein DFH09DRAFT_1375863 [Mycena vulgaris]
MATDPYSIRTVPMSSVIIIVAGTDWKLVPSANARTVAPDKSASGSALPALLRGSPPTTLFSSTLELTINRRRPLLYGRPATYRVSDTVLLESGARSISPSRAGSSTPSAAAIG